jgi:hypothetical protein
MGTPPGWELEHRARNPVSVKNFIIPIAVKEPGYLSCMALGYGLDDRGFESRQGLGIFLFTAASRLALGPTQPPIQWLPGALSLG